MYQLQSCRKKERRKAIFHACVRIVIALRELIYITVSIVVIRAVSVLWSLCQLHLRLLILLLLLLVALRQAVWHILLRQLRSHIFFFLCILKYEGARTFFRYRVGWQGCQGEGAQSGVMNPVPPQTKIEPGKVCPTG